MILKNSIGKEYGKVDFDLAEYAKELENIKAGEKLKTPLKLAFSNCEEDPKAYIDVVIIYQKREDKKRAERL